jgi:chemotaxis response regulator CheB
MDKKKRARPNPAGNGDADGSEAFTAETPEPDGATPSVPPIVGIGASAGGTSGLQAFARRFALRHRLCHRVHSASRTQSHRWREGRRNRESAGAEAWFSMDSKREW